MSPPIFPIVYPALRSLLVNRLQKSLDFQDAILFQQMRLADPDKLAVNLSQFSSSWIQAIPLNRIKSETQIEYISALGFKLSQYQHQSASSLAQQIVTNLNRSIKLNQIDPVNDRIWQNFIISVTDPGWIHLRLADPGLAEWLQHLTSAPLIFSEQEEMLNNTRINRKIDHFDQNSPHLFAALHAHARCCTVLQMANREGLILLNQQPKLDAEFSIAQRLPWLNSEQTLRYLQHKEWLLIGQISDALDYLSRPVAEDRMLALKVASSLSQAFQSFYAACQIWGDIKRYDQRLAQVRLGLVLITQRVLRCLLEQRLKLQAPIEL